MRKNDDCAHGRDAEILIDAFGPAPGCQKLSQPVVGEGEAWPRCRRARNVEMRVLIILHTHKKKQ